MALPGQAEANPWEGRAEVVEVGGEGEVRQRHCHRSLLQGEVEVGASWAQPASEASPRETASFLASKQTLALAEVIRVLSLRWEDGSSSWGLACLVEVTGVAAGQRVQVILAELR
jgi:hypothetical protein